MSLHHIHQTTSVKKTISIIGNGTAGVLSVAYFLGNTDWNIT
jgi:predicted NAD/FAD-binding protein